MRSYLSSLLIFSSALASADAARPFPTPSNPISRKALKIRGGWNPLDGVDAAKTIPKLGLGLGTATSLSTKTVLDKLGIEKVDPVSFLVARRIGVFIMTYSIIAYSLQCQGASVSTAVGLGCLPTIVELSKTLFDGEHKELKIPAAGQVIVLSVTAVFCLSFLNGSPISGDRLLKLYSGWTVINGVFMGCFPELACKTIGNIDASSMSTLKKFVSIWGFSILSVGTLAGCLATDMTNERALALGTVPFLSKLILSKSV